MGKKIIIGLLGLLLIAVTALTIFFYTDHRYSYTIRTYRALSEVQSMEIAYKSRMGLGENHLGIHGTAAMTFAPKAAYIEVYTELPFLGSQKIMDIYTEEKEIYHKFNLAFLPWQSGIPMLSEDAFNPSNLTELSPKAEILPILRFLSSFRKKNVLIRSFVLLTSTSLVLHTIKARINFIASISSAACHPLGPFQNGVFPFHFQRNMIHLNVGNSQQKGYVVKGIRLPSLHSPLQIYKPTFLYRPY